MGVGGEFPAEFEAVGVPLSERGSLADEAIEVLRSLWNEDGVEHQGSHFSCGPVTLQPKPLQENGPPIIVGGRKGPSFRRAGCLGDGYLLMFAFLPSGGHSELLPASHQWRC